MPVRVHDPKRLRIYFLTPLHHVVLIDEQGTKLADRDYSGLQPTSPFQLPGIALHRLPDKTGFLLHVSPNYLFCLDNDGSACWARSGLVPGNIPPSTEPDGSALFTTAIPRTAGFPDAPTHMIQLNSDGSLAWARIIQGDDLSTHFQFHTVAGAGVLYRFTDHLALGIESRFGHFSNARIKQPDERN